MKIERNDRKKVFAKDVDYGAVVLIDNQPYMCMDNMVFESPHKQLPFINLESGDVEFFDRMAETLEVNAKLVID